MRCYEDANLVDLLRKYLLKNVFIQRATRPSPPCHRTIDWTYSLGFNIIKILYKTI